MPEVIVVNPSKTDPAEESASESSTTMAASRDSPRPRRRPYCSQPSRTQPRFSAPSPAPLRQDAASARIQHGPSACIQHGPYLDISIKIRCRGAGVSPLLCRTSRLHAVPLPLPQPPGPELGLNGVKVVDGPEGYTVSLVWNYCA